MTRGKVAVVVQRWHPGTVGGSESLAWQYARLLRHSYAVDLLTTTARDYFTWDNVLPEGEEQHEGITVRRFRVTLGRGGRGWQRLNGLLRRHDALRRGGRPPGLPNPPADLEVCHHGEHDQEDDPDVFLPWSLALQEDWIRHQGPYSEPLLQFLEEHAADYRALLFVTYLYPTTYFGLGVAPAGRCLLVPALHDEPAAYLPAYRRRARAVRGLLWLSDAEARLGRNLWGQCPGQVVAMPVETAPAAPARRADPYILYCGRIEAAKGCDHLLEWFLAFKAARPSRSRLRLVLTGDDKMGLPRHPDLDYQGFVSDARKRALMAGAAVFVLPSAYESFSLATLEAMAQRTPVLVNGACAVLAEHVARSGAGRVYRGRDEFFRGLDELLGLSAAGRAEMGARGRKYVVGRFQAERVAAALISAIEGLGEPADAPGSPQCWF
jgi:glycosyltransferase involved in cell wall biosynthesis